MNIKELQDVIDKYSISLSYVTHPPFARACNPPTTEQISNLFNDLNSLTTPDMSPKWSEWDADNKTTPFKVASFLLNLGNLAKWSDRQLKSQLIDRLFISLSTQGERYQRTLSPKTISSALTGLTQLVKEDRIESMFKSEFVNSLFASMSLMRDQQIDARVINDYFYCLVQLSKKGLLQGDIDLNSINGFLAKLLICPDLNLKGVTYCLFNLGQLSDQGKCIFSNGPVRENLSQLINQLLELNPTSSLTNQALSNIGAICYTTPDYWCPPQVIRLFKLRTNTNRFISFHDALRLIDSLIVFKRHHLELNESFTRAINALNIPYERYYPEEIDQVNEYIAELVDVPEWQRQLQKKLGLTVSQDKTTNFEPVLPEEITLLETTLPHAATSSEEPVLPFQADTDGQTSADAESDSVLTPVVDIPTEAPRGPHQPIVVRTRIPSNLTPTPFLQKVPTNPVIEKAYNTNIIFKAIADNDEKLLLDILQTPTTPAKSPKTKRLCDHFSENRPSSSDQTTQEPHRGQLTDTDLIVFKFFRTPIEALEALIKSSPVARFETVLRSCSLHARYQLAINDALNPIILNTRARGLESFIETLIILGLYCDHQAVLHLNNALKTRNNVHELQIMLMREAYRFHQLRENRHVLPSLIEAYRELLRDNDMLVDVVDDQILQDSLRRVGRGKPTDLVVVPPSPKKRSSTTAGFFAQRIIAAQTPSPSHSGPRMIPIFSDLPRGNQERVSPRYTRITNPAYIPRDVEKVDLPCYKEAALPVPEKPDERAFDPHAPVLIKRDRTANLDSMYTSEDIEAILRIKINLLQERQHIALLAAEDWGNNVIKPALERYLEGRELDAVPFKHIILPICMTTAVHWVGVRLSVLDNNQIGISYYDSLPQDQGWTTRRDQVMSQAIEAAKQLFNGKKISVRDYPWLEQTDPTSCGAYLIENVYYSLKLKEDDSDYWRPNAPDLALQIRTRHLDLLQQYRNDYYETVLRKACTDEEAEEGPFKRQRNLPAFPT